MKRARTRGGTRAWLALAATLAVCAASAEARAQSELSAAERDELARAHFRSGARFFEQQRFAEAALEFEQVHELSGQAALLYNVGRAWEAAGRAREATRAYQRFLESDAQGAERASVQSAIARLATRAQEEERAASQRAASGCPEPSPAVAAAANLAGASTSAGGAGANAGSSASENAARGPLLQLRTRVTFQHRPLDAVAPWVLLGIAGVTGGLAAWQTAAWATDAGRVRNATTWSPELTNSYFASRDEGNTAIVFGSVAGASALGAALWFIARGRGERHEELLRSATVLPVGRGGAALVIGGVF